MNEELQSLLLKNKDLAYAYHNYSVVRACLQDTDDLQAALVETVISLARAYATILEDHILMCQRYPEKIFVKE